jgi:SAM-dependent methyltransferase
MQRIIKVGILVSYDYEYLKNSLPSIYEHADKIVLAVDKDRKTWAGNFINIPDYFWQWVEDFDTQHKIEIYRDSFYVEGLTSMQCETRERNMLAKYMGDGGWHVQLDADEYFIDFEHFVGFLHYLDKKRKHINCVVTEWLTLFKRTTNGFLFIKNNEDQIPLATIMPQYCRGRQVAHPNTILYPQRVLHDSWARTEQDLWIKLSNWGHNTDFNVEGYFHYWKAIDEKNYMFVHNFSPIVPEKWKKLEYIKAGNISDLLSRLKKHETSGLLKATKLHRNKFQRVIQLFIPPIFKEIKTRIKKLPVVVSIQRLIYIYKYKQNKNCDVSSYNVFTDIYYSNLWGSQESKSGPGSTFETTIMIRKQLPLIIEKYNIQSILDVPCGDYNWMKTVKKMCNYIGGDIVAGMIEHNQKLYASDKVQFKLIDITKDTLPMVDLIFCKDCLQHLSDANVHKALRNFKKSGAKYLLVTSYPRTWVNHDIEDGGYRPLNLRKSPFHLPTPLLKVREIRCPYIEIDKTMYLYKLDELIFKDNEL